MMRRASSLTAIALGAGAMAGWASGNLALAGEFIPGWQTMKFVTATCFVLAGCVGLLPRASTRTIDAIRTALAFAILTIMGLKVLSQLADVPISIDSFMRSHANGPPSVGTILAFGVFAAYAMFAPYWPMAAKTAAGLFIAAMGGIALAGLALSEPALQFDFGELPGMAITTAAGFVAIGTSIVYGAKPVKGD